MAPTVLIDHVHLESHQQELADFERKQNEFGTQDQSARFPDSLQNHQSITPIQQSSTSTVLISSPYLEPTHHLDLTTLDAQSQLFARALAVMEPTGPDYAVADYTTAFNWPTVMAALQHFTAEARQAWTRQSFYTVIFRSRLTLTVDRELLHQLDKESHREATLSGGLLKYWFGTPNAERRNLATCKLFDGIKKTTRHRRNLC